MFAIRVTYLTGAVRAADVGTGNDKAAPEWPPHPSRVYSALVSAWAVDGCRPEARTALEWLEHQPAPLLSASDAFPRSPTQSFVPANDKLGAKVRNPRRFPAAVPMSETVDFIWPGSEPSEEQRVHLGHLMELVPSLGHSSSLVWVRPVESPAEWTLSPSSTGTLALRVPTLGRLQHLEAAFEAGRFPLAGRWQTYAPPVRPEAAPLHGIFGEMVIFRLRPDGDAIPIEGALRVCRAFRGAMMALADQPVDAAISGHEAGHSPAGTRPIQRPHVAYAALPDVGHRHARSHIMGVAALVPLTLTADERRAVLRALGRMRTLTLGPLGTATLERVSVDVRLSALRESVWSRPSDTWATVSPVVLDRHPADPYGREAEDIVRESCRRVGVPAPSLVELGRASWVVGAPPANAFPARHEKAGRARRFHVHARLTFSEPVTGPLSIGAGRFYGYGLCRPVSGGT